MSAPPVDVLVPTYNHAAFVGEALEGVLAQDYEPLHVIVSDDASSDDTVDVVRRYVEANPGRITLLANETNAGIAGNFNRLLDAVSGTYYAWLSGDDVMLPGKIRRQVALLESRPDAAGSIHDAEIFESETGRVLGRFSEVQNGRTGFLEGGAELWFRPGYYTLPSTMMVRADARPARGYDPRFPVANEWIFDIETYLSGPCVPLDEVLGRYRRHGDNVTSSEDYASLHLEETMLVIACVQARHPELTPHVRLRRTGLLVSAALDRRAAGDGAGMRQLLRAALSDGGPVNVVRSIAAFGRVALGRRRLGVPRPA